MSNYDIIGLFPHNIKSYEKIKEAFKTKNIAAIVHSTGTGKSYNGLQLAYDNQDKKVLFVVPSNSIIEHLKEIIEKNPNVELNKDFKNLKFITYQSISSLKKSELDELDIDILILDEFHHIGAPIWGAAVDEIINSHKDLKVLGMSAYTIRDRGTYKERNMIEEDGDELFSGSVVSNYDLCDAIIDGVLPKPIYKSAYIHLEETYKELEKVINKLTPNSPNYHLLSSLMNDIRNRIHEAPSMKDVFKENIRKNGKYIYFCPVMYENDVNDISTIINEAKSWIYDMGLTDDDFVIYTSTSKMGIQGTKNRKAFYHDKDLDDNDVSKKLRIMFAINQYNEGSHVPGIDGVIMGRTTASDIVYFEQLGRGLSTRGNIIEEYNILKDKSFDELISLCKEKGININNINKKEKLIELLLSPVIIDLANNINYIQELEHILKERINDDILTNTRHNNTYTVNPTFDTSMKNEDLYEILQYIKTRLFMKWDDFYALAVEYYKHYNNLDISSDFKTINGYTRDENGYNLGNWIIQQRQYKKNNNLSEEKIKKLEKIGMIWSIRLDWNGMYDLAKKYYEKKGNSNIPKEFKTINGYDYNEKGYSLGGWFYQQKNYYNNKPLEYSQEKIELLEDINIDWNRENDYYINSLFEKKLMYCQYNKLDINDISDDEFLKLFPPHTQNAFNMKNYKSLDEHIDEEQVIDIDDTIFNHALKDNLNDIINTFNERERDIVTHLYGLNNEPVYTQKELGEKYNLTGSRIGAINAKAIKKLRRPPNRKILRDFYQSNEIPMLSIKEQVKIKTNHKCDLLVDYLFDYDNKEKAQKYLDSLCIFYFHINKKKFEQIIHNNTLCYIESFYGENYSYNYKYNLYEFINLFNNVISDINRFTSTSYYSSDEEFIKNGYHKASEKNKI